MSKFIQIPQEHGGTIYVSMDHIIAVNEDTDGSVVLHMEEGAPMIAVPIKQAKGIVNLLKELSC